MEKFYKFLDGIQKAVNISEIERLGGLPDKSIAKHYVWRNTQKGWPLPEKHIPKIFIALCMAFKVVDYYGALVKWDDEIKVFFIEIPTGAPDVAKEKPGHFVYTRESYKEVYDHFDFMDWLQNQEKH